MRADRMHADRMHMRADRHARDRMCIADRSMRADRCALIVRALIVCVLLLQVKHTYISPSVGITKH